MLRPLLAVMMLCVISGSAFAHPNYPGLESRQDSFEVSGRSVAGRGHKAVSESRSGRNALAIARRYIGTNPTGWKRLWCAVFVSHVEKKAGRPGSGSALAKSYASYGKRVPLSKARAGDIVVLARKGGGHVGYLVAKEGNAVTLISGNTGGAGPGRRVVAQGNYPVSRVIAVVRPS